MVGRSGHAAMRLLVLGLLTLGVVGMHTLGHPSSHDAPATSTKAVPAHSTHSSASMGAMAATAPVAANGKKASSLTEGTRIAPSSHDPAGTGVGLDPMSVCLGVLTMLGLIIAGRLLRLLRDEEATATRRQVGVGASGTRGPPGRPAVGLHLADLSVQRI